MYKAKRSLLVLPAACLFFLTGSQAFASFTYSVTPDSPVLTFGGSTVTITGVSSVTPQTTPTDGVIWRVADTSTTSPASTDTANLALSEEVAITDQQSATIGTIDVTGTLQFLRSDSGGEVSFFTPSSSSFSTTIGDTLYTLTNFSYTGPTINGASTATSAEFDSSLIATAPEPAALALMGLGLLGIATARRAFRK